MLSSRARRFSSAWVAALLAVGLSAVVDWQRPGQAGAAPSPAVASLPDLVSARIAAAAQGSRVEVTSLDSETTTTWVNPDGTLTTDISSQPMQAQDANGNWQPLNETLAKSPNGTVAPDAAVTGVVFGKAGSPTAAHLGSAANGAAVDWQDPLPKPQLDGDTATYPDVYNGTNLTAQPTPTGFELSLVVKDAAAAAALPDSIDLPLAGNGLTWSLSGDGVLVATNAKGKAVVTSAGASAWDDTQGQHTDEPVHSTALALSLTGSVGSQVLHVTTPRALLTDPATVYPVTIDPSATWSETAWTYVDSGYPNTSFYNDAGPAKVGTFNSGGDKDRSLFRFATAGLAGKHILSATFHIWEKWSWSCTPSEFDIWGIPSAFNSGTTWNNQPGVGVERGSITAAKGYDSSCPAGSVSADLTSWAQSVAAGGQTYDELELRSPNETDNTYWKKFNIDPHVTVTYNSYPGKAGSLSVKPCSSQCSATVLTNTSTPSLTAKASDADGGKLEYDYEVWNAADTTRISTGKTTGVASGSSATWTVPSGKLTNGASYQYRVRAYDGTDYGTWSNWLPFTIDTSAPAKPSLSSSTWTAGTWSSATGGTISWSDTSSDVASYSWKLDGGTWSTPSTATSTKLANLAKNKEHTVSVKATDKAGNLSALGALTFGVGSGGLSSPNDQDRTQRSVTLSAAGPEPYVAYQWRRGTTATWANIPLARVSDPSSGANPTAWPVPIGASWTWDVAGTAGNRDGLIQSRACLYTSSADTTPTCQDNPVDVQLVTHTFGASYATQQVGPGQVSLLTGDYSIDATDADITAPTGSLSVSRSLTTLAPAASNSTATGVFGPGWTASLDGPGAGAADETATIASDNSYVVLTGADGAAAVYVASGSLTNSPISYTGIGDAADGSMLSYNYAATTPTLTLTSPDGTQTNWTQQGTGTSTSWVPQSVIETGAAAQTTASYYYTGPAPGLPSRIVAPAPAGITCSSQALAASTKGCRSLVFGYTAMTVAGTTVQRLTSVSLNAWNPNKAGGAGMDTVAIAAYDYDTSGRLADAWDPRISPSLTTHYTYDANNRLTSLTPPGQAAWSFTYDGTDCPSAPSCGRLVTVSRPDPSGQTATSTIVYGVPLSGAGLPNLTSSATATWGQYSDLPVAGASAAIFHPDHVPAGTSPTTVAAGDWPYASISYLDVDGRTVDTASYGAGDWQIDSTAYDTQGDEVWSLTAGNRAQALNPTTDTDPYVAALTDTADRADALATISTYNADGTELIDQQGPTHPVTVTLSDGSTSTVDARSDEATCYDDMACNTTPAPTGGPYYLPVSDTTSAVGVDGTVYDAQISHAGYDGTTPNGTTGWALRQPTSQTDPGGLVTTTHYDNVGRVIETDLPHNGDNAGVRATVYTYYSASTGTCGDAAEVGLLCQTSPAAQPSSGPPLPVVTYSYDMYGNAVSKTETAGSTIRTTTISYDDAERVVAIATAVTPTAAGGTALPAISYGYDPNTGLPTTVSTTVNGTATTLTTGYDTLGQATNYTDATGNLSITRYDLDGRVVSVKDGKGTTTYVYDSNIEHRGLITSEDLGLTGSPSTFTVAYDPAANPATVTYPNGLVAASDYDNAGNLTNLTYSMSGIPWLEFDQNPDELGREVAQSSPASDQIFAYDGAGRLTTVQDTVADPISGNTVCTTRVYGFDNDSNRTSLTTYPDTGADPANGSCATDLTSNNPSRVPSSNPFDQADRITNPGYAYDNLGRTTNVPAADAAGAGSHSGVSGDLSLGYYANDMIATESQGGQSIAYTLDPLQNRINSFTDSTTGATTVNHYSDNSDSPTWTETGSNWTRNLLSPGGSLIGTVDQTGSVSFGLTNPHGDSVAAVADDPNVVSPSSYQESTEYGQPRDSANGYNTYSWLGGKRRSSDTLGGLTIMGVRLYDPQTGRFLSPDPVANGNANAYIYPADPINDFDTTGQTHWVKRWTFRLNHHEAERVGHAMEIGGSVAEILAPWLSGIPGAGEVLAALDEIAGGYIEEKGRIMLYRNGPRGVDIEIGLGFASWWFPIPHPIMNIRTAKKGRAPGKNWLH